MIQLATPMPLVLPLAVALQNRLEKKIRWTWDYPLWATVFLAVLAVLWIAAIYYRENSPAGKRLRALLVLMRTAAVALVLIMFAQPIEQWYRQGKPRLVVLVDHSASMNTVDVEDDGKLVSRRAGWQAALTAATNPLLSQWQETYELDVVTFDEEFTRLGLEQGQLLDQLAAKETAVDPQTGTRLGDALHYALRELPGRLPAAVVVFTDGVSNRGRALRVSARQARGLRVPLFTVAVGSERRRPDVAVENLLVEEIVFPGDRLHVEATLRAVGLENQTVQVKLRNKAQDQVLAQTTARLPPDGVAQIVRLAIRPRDPGALPLEFSVESPADEANPDNNSVEQVVEVRDQKIRVLLVQSSPSYEFRALKSLLERDPVVDLSVRLQEADADFAEIDSAALRAFPVRAEELLEYDVVLLGDVDPGLLPRSVWPRLEQFVTRHGGGLVCIAGPRFMPAAYRGNRSLELLLPIELAAINPLRWQATTAESYPIHPTTLGWQSPSLQLGDTLRESQAIWRRLPPLFWLLEIERIKPGAQVLAEHPERTNRSGDRLPILLRHYVGAGEVLFHATDETWRWRWRTDDRYFARYWGQVVRRLGRSRLTSGRQGVVVTSDRTRYQPGEPVRLQVRFRNPGDAPVEEQGVVVRLQAASGPPREVRLQRRLGLRGVFETTLNELVSGSYEVLLMRPDRGGQPAQAQFAVQSPPREWARVAVDRAGLTEAADLTGGGYYTLANIEELARSLPQPQMVNLDELPPRLLWNTHGMLTLFVVVLCSEWFLRRRHGML
ncbi:MAG: VWA domain-containing protein [Pirellulales bacterium]|nr:VWA domain-containing protein [Pirellulales bacterium]